MGKIISVKIVNKEGKSKGYGFVEFENNDSAIKFVKKCQGIIIDEHAL